MAPKFVLLVILFGVNIITTHSQTDDFYDFSTTTIDLPQENAFPAPWIYGMVFTGITGIILITSMGCHSVYNFSKHNLMTKPARALYVLFFISYLMTCIAYTFFRTDLILPMGTTISCTIGYYLTTNSVYFSKCILFIIFMYRIDLAFHKSALGYSRVVLFCITFSYFAITTILNAAFIFVTKDIITFQESLYFNGAITGICTSGSDDSKYTGLYTLVLGLLFLGDMIFNILLCGLFVHKLRIVVKMGADQHHSSTSTKLTRGGTQRKKDDKLKKVMRKQTSLVLLACLSTMLILGTGAVLSGFSLMMPLDATVNTFCVWLMFTFSDKVWNKIIHTCCFCCFCCDCCCHKDQFLITLHSVSRAMSLRSASTMVDSKDKEPNGNIESNIKASDEKKDIKISFANAKTVTLDEKKKKGVSDNAIASDTDAKSPSMLSYPDAGDTDTIEMMELKHKKSPSVEMEEVADQSQSGDKEIPTS